MRRAGRSVRLAVLRHVEAATTPANFYYPDPATHPTERRFVVVPLCQDGKTNSLSDVTGPVCDAAGRPE